MNGNFETSLNLSWAIVAILMVVVVPLGVFLLLEIRRVRAEVREMKKFQEKGPSDAGARATSERRSSE